MIKQYQVLSKVCTSDLERDQIVRAFKFIVLGISCPIMLLWRIYYMYERAEVVKEQSQLRSYRIVNGTNNKSLNFIKVEISKQMLKSSSARDITNA